MMRRLALSLFLIALWSAPVRSAPDDIAPDAAGSALSCVVLPDEQVEVSSAVPGVITEMMVRRSDRVEAGQVVARLESSVEEASLALASARASTDAELELRRVELHYDLALRDRLTALHHRSAVSSQNREDGERAADESRLRVRIARDRREEALLERRRARAVLALKTIRSPISGVVVRRHRTVGEYIEDQPVVRIVRLDPLRVEVIAPLPLFGKVHRGMRIGVRPETDPDHERVAIVKAVDPVADPGSGTFGIELELPNPEHGLPAGIKCRARVLSLLAEGAPAQPAVATVPDRSRARPTRAVAAGPSGSTAPPGPSRPEREEAIASVAPTQRTQSSAAAVRSPLGFSRDGAGSIELRSSWHLARSSASRDGTLRASTGTCLAYEGARDEAAARRLAAAAARMGVQVAVSEADEVVPGDYIVVTAPEPARERRSAVVDRLHDAGITDLAVIGSGRLAHRVSLGTYRGPASAERRRAALAGRGFDVEVMRLQRSQRHWRVDLALPAGMEAASLTSTLDGVAGVRLAASRACAPLATAAR